MLLSSLTYSLNYSGPLTVILERDMEDAPDDPRAYNVVVCASGTNLPDLLGAGYLHLPYCAYRKAGGCLCDVGWLEEYVRCVGAFALIDGTDCVGPNRIKITGHLCSYRYGNCIDGYDYDEVFEIISCEVLDK